MTQLLIGLLMGAFFIGLGLYQLKTKTLITGGRQGETHYDRNPGLLLYIFAPLEIVVGVAALVCVGVTALHSAQTAGHCDLSAEQSECTEYLGRWTADEMSQLCSKPIAPGECAHDNLLGTCTLERTGKKSVTYFQSFVVLAQGPRQGWTPTKKEQSAECARRGGTWHPM